MRRFTKHILLTATAALLCCSSLAQIVEVQGSFVEQLQKRDSILIADQLRYGIEMKDVASGTVLSLPDWSAELKDTLILVQNWQLDTLKTKGRDAQKKYDIRAYMILAPFEVGEYQLPRIALQRSLPDGKVDTLLFDAQKVDVTAMPIDTATFTIHDIKSQIRYPITFKEIVPYFLALLLLVALVVGVVVLVIRYRRKTSLEETKEAPYIVALRKLEHWRSDKYWVPEKQKLFYSGITDALREYIAATFGIDACEMTTAEIFDTLKSDERLPKELYGDVRALFELADIVKFAKHTASEQENAGALPLAVRFVTGTYQATVDKEAAAVAEKEKEG